MSALYSKADVRIPASLLLSSWGRRSLSTLPHSSLVAGCLTPLAVQSSKAQWSHVSGAPTPHGQGLAASTLLHETDDTTACKASFSNPCGSSSSTHAVSPSVVAQDTFPPTCKVDGQLFLKNLNLVTSRVYLSTDLQDPPPPPPHKKSTAKLYPIYLCI
jgi:hypothetical protein